MLVKQLVLIALLCYSAEAWMARGSYLNDAHPGKCYISETVIISPGETVKSPNNCAEISCESADGMATIFGCGSVGAPPGCEWGDYININAPFQECCARHLICKDGMTEENKSFHDMIIKMFKETAQTSTVANLITKT